MSQPGTPPPEVLVDVNVFEDVYRRRRGWRASAAVLTAIRRGRAIGHVCALTPAILYFFRSQHHPEDEARRLVRTALTGFRVAAIAEAEITAAYDSALPDFEDAIQHACASSAGASHIVTRNLVDFAGSQVPAITPEAFLRLLPGRRRRPARPLH